MRDKKTGISQFSGQDVCSGLWESAEHGTLIVSSVYCDGTVDALPELFLEVLDYCKDKGISHLTLMDSNAHHPSMWGSKGQLTKGHDCCWM